MADVAGHVVKNGSVWAWKPGATPETRVTSQFPSLPPDPRLRGYQEAAAEGLTGIKTSDQTGFSMADIIKLFGSRSSGPNASDVLARDKFNYEKKQDANKTSGLSDYYTGWFVQRGL
jgi:hypothetical protein